MEVRARVENAVRRVLKEDTYLLEVKANERSITHRLAIYLETQFPDYNVDCEYNRMGRFPKRLDSFRKSIDSNDDKGVSVFPDIIVHHRCTESNFMVIEAKLSSNEDSCARTEACTCDRCKLAAYKAELGYTHAFYIVFPVAGELVRFTDAKLAECITSIP